MRKLRTTVLTGVAMLAVAGTALAAGHDMHQMKVGLPDGSIARIEYQGDVAPKVSVTPALHFVPVALFDPFDPIPFDSLDRVAEQMHRQASALMRQVNALQAVPFTANGKLDLAAFGKLPPGTVSYSFVSTSNGNGNCYRSVQVTSYGTGAQPKVVSNGTGKCDPADQMPTRTRLDDRTPGDAPVMHTGTATTAGQARPANTV